jgi:hypothetical protein
VLNHQEAAEACHHNTLEVTMIAVRRVALPILACPFILLAGACSDPVSPSLADRDAALLAGASDVRQVTVPFTSHFFTDQMSLVPDPVCGAPPRLLNTQVGMGEATHLGRFSIRITFCLDATDLLDDGQLTEGESAPYDGGVGVLTAANGDELHITVAGAVVPSDHPDFDFEFDDPYTITGGTGRFAGATGSGTTNSLVSRAMQPTRTTHNWTGSLTLMPGR